MSRPKKPLGRPIAGWVHRPAKTALVLLLLALAACGVNTPVEEARVLAEPGPSEGFARVEGPQVINFPADHGPHPDYQTEWWYYTGNLSTAEGRRFGYQLTFFRRALLPPALRQDRPSTWATDQVYMAHFALTDVSGRRFRALERFARGAVGLSGASADPFRVWLQDWAVEALGPDQYRLTAAQGDLSLELTLVDLKGPVLQGQEGYSQKGAELGNASTYISMTRLETQGTVVLPEGEFTVSGLSWMDHEYSTSALSAGQVGWDWFSIQLDDGSDLMLFQIRREDKSVDPFSSGTLIAPDGSTRHLGRDQFEIQVDDTWRSPRSGAEYPARWTITVPSADLTLRLRPLLADQELDLSYAYWEGAVEVEGVQAGNALRGYGYVEMTGYAASMQGQF